jgi:hypothetical protein
MLSKFLLFFFLRNKHEFKNFYDVNQNKIVSIPKIYNNIDKDNKDHFIYLNEKNLENNIKRIFFTLVD